MFFFARPPSCFPFTRLLAFRVTRTSRQPRRLKISPRLPAHVVRSAHPTRTDASFQYSRPRLRGTSPMLSHSCELYVVAKKPQLLCKQANPNSFHKTPGVGASATLQRSLALGVVFCDPEICLPNFFACHTYKIAPRKSFPCHTYKKVGGGQLSLTTYDCTHQLARAIIRSSTSLTGASG